MKKLIYLIFIPFILSCSDNDPQPETENNWVKIELNGKELTFASDSITFYFENFNHGPNINHAFLVTEIENDSLSFTINADSVYAGLELVTVNYYDWFVPYPYPSFQIIYKKNGRPAMQHGFYNNEKKGLLVITSFDNQIIKGQFETELAEYVKDPTCNNCIRPSEKIITISGEFQFDLNYNTH